MGILSVGVSYAELRYDVPNLVNKPEKMDGTYSIPPPGVHAVNNADHIPVHSQSAQLQGGTIILLLVECS